MFKVKIHHLKFVLLGFLFIYAGRMSAQQDFESTMHQAEVLFEAEDYGRAISLYEILLDRQLEPWQQATLKYNIGTAELAQGKWEQALSFFQDISGNDLSPLLKARLASNMAFARLMQAKDAAASFEKQSAGNQGQEAYSQVLFLFNQTLNTLTLAEHASCELGEAEGAKECIVPRDIIEMRKEAKIGLAHFLETYSSYRLAHLSLQGAAAALLSETEALLKRLEFLQNSSMDESLKIQYATAYVDVADTWLPLWSFLKELEKKEKLEMESALKQASKDFISGLDLMQKMRFEESQVEIKKSNVFLRDLLQAALDKTPLRESVRQLSASYDFLLEQDPLQEMTLNGVVQLQENFGKLLETAQKPELNVGFQKAQGALESGKHAFEDFKLIQAHMWIEIARASIQGLGSQLESPSENKAKTILEQAIRQEQLALSLNRLRQQMQGREPSTEEVDALPSEAQKETVKVANGFLAAAIAYQREIFEKKPPESACQKHPWDEVIPLFTEGLNSAIRAADVLSQDVSRLRSVIPLGEMVLARWKEALSKLNAPTVSSQAEQEQQKKAEKAPSGTSTSSLNQVVRFIQEMEADDKSYSAIQESPAKSTVERPW